MCLQSKLLQRAREVRGHLKNMLRRFAPVGAVFSSCVEDTKAVRRCVIAGYFSNAAQLANDGMYVTVRGRRRVVVHPSSVFAKFGAPPEWVVFHDVIHTKASQIREISKIEPRWLLEQAPHYYTTKA